MKKYIKAAISENTTVSLDGEWIDNLDSKSAFDPRIMVSVCFEEDAGYFEVEGQEPAMVDEALAFGMIIKDGLLLVPKNMEFTIRIERGYVLTHNGVDIYNWVYFEGYPVRIKFTPLGYKCYAISEAGDKSFDTVVDAALTFSKYKDYFDANE